MIALCYDKETAAVIALQAGERATTDQDFQRALDQLEHLSTGIDGVLALVVVVGTNQLPPDAK